MEKLWNDKDVFVVNEWLNAKTERELTSTYRKLEPILLRVANNNLSNLYSTFMYDRKYLVETCVNHVALRLRDYYKTETDINPFNFIFVCTKNYLHDVYARGLTKSGIISKAHIDDFDYDIDVADESQNICEYDEEVTERILAFLSTAMDKERLTLSQCTKVHHNDLIEEKQCIRYAKRNIIYLTYFQKFIQDFGCWHLFSEIQEYIQNAGGLSDREIGSCTLKFFKYTVYPTKARLKRDKLAENDKFSENWMNYDFTPTYANYYYEVKRKKERKKEEEIQDF